MENYKVKVSVIMPVYNSGLYLKTAVDSILSQSLKEIELILVDDGSTDGSSEQCDEYARQDNRVVVIHQKNGGICNARNAALKIARGEYVGFSDHDDEYLPDILKSAFDFASANGLDMLKYGHETFYINGDHVFRKRKFYTDDKTLDCQQFHMSFFNLANEGVLICVWDGLYKRKFIESNNLTFNEIFKSGGEDLDFIGKISKSCSNVGFMSKIGYRHYLRYGYSTSTSSFKKAHLDNIMTLPERLKSYFPNDKFDFVIQQDKLSYSIYMLREYIGATINRLASSSCDMQKKEKTLIMRKLHVNVKNEIFDVSLLGLIKNAPKYALLYVLFKYKLFSFCLRLYR